MARDLRKDWLVTATEFEANRGHYVTRHGTMRMILHQPVMPNVQQPHTQDELYIIVAGQGQFEKAGETRTFRAGDVIFVEAGVEHRFLEISPDTQLWVIFWGPEGGEEKGCADAN